MNIPGRGAVSKEAGVMMGSRNKVGASRTWLGVGGCPTASAFPNSPIGLPLTFISGSISGKQKLDWLEPVFTAGNHQSWLQQANNNNISPQKKRKKQILCTLPSLDGREIKRDNSQKKALRGRIGKNGKGVLPKHIIIISLQRMGRWPHCGIQWVFFF